VAIAILVILLLALVLSLVAPALARPVTLAAEDATRVVEILPLRGGFIDPPVADQVVDVLDLAEREGSELVVLQFTSPGGVSVDTDALVARMQASRVPIAVLIGPLGTGAQARGAAALVWLAADARALALDATVGPLEPIDLTELDAPALDDAALAALVAPGGGDLATLARLRTEALDADTLVASGLARPAQGLEPLLLELDGVTVTTAAGEVTLRLRADELSVRFHSLGLVRRLLHAATTAPFIYLLVVVGLGLLLFEVFQPGFGVAGLAGIITLAVGVFGLTVLPVTWWAVALVVLGLLLYALDTSIAGFGPVTLAATVALAVGSWRFYDADALALDPWLVAATTLGAFVFFVFVMTTVLRAQAGPEGVAVSELIGRPGVVRSILNPEGHVFIDGALWRARWTGDERRAKVGTPVVVHGVDGPLVLVGPFEAAPMSPPVTGGAEPAGTPAND
jgi:membrane-bound serine protease (ClpP class)